MVVVVVLCGGCVFFEIVSLWLWLLCCGCACGCCVEVVVVV